MSTDAKEAGSAGRISCPLCGSDKFTWGVAMAAYSIYCLPLQFKLDNAGWFSGGLTVKARKCDSCGNIQLFAAPK